MYYCGAAVVIVSMAAFVIMRRITTKIGKKSLDSNMFLVLPDIYRPYGPDERMRIVIEYNMKVGPVATHFDNGDKWGFLSAHFKHRNTNDCFITRWSRFVDDYMEKGVHNIAAIATHVSTDSMRLTLSSENVVLHDMVLGKEFVI